MKNKHQIFFLVFFVPTFGEGGGSSRLGQNPKFARKFFWTVPLMTWHRWGWPANMPEFVFCIVLRRRWPPCLLSMYNCQCIEICRSIQHQNDWFTMLLGGGDDHPVWWSGRSVCVWRNDCSPCSSYVKVTNTKSVSFASICTWLNSIFCVTHINKANSSELFIHIVFVI